ncbi:MAG: trypsin-like peptidase domain-containing protein [Actinomycetota bacterium]|nr:trypsin-like peptidase domain-containing protein [Actinomycetota bacterium]
MNPGEPWPRPYPDPNQPAYRDWYGQTQAQPQPQPQVPPGVPPYQTDQFYPGPPAPPTGPIGSTGPTGPGAGPGAKRSARGSWLVIALVAAVIGAVVGGGVGAAVARNGGTTHTVVNQVIQPNTSVIVHSATVRQILAKVQPGVVTISTNLGAGTGMIVSADGQVLTNYHVISGAKTIEVTLYNSTTPQAATLLGGDSTDDVALLKITDGSGLPTVTLGDSSKLQVGDDVVAIGNALDLAGGPTVTSGIVSAVGRTLKDPNLPQNLIQTDAAINPGNSGGPLVNSSGEVVGMNTLVIQQANSSEAAQNLGFAIPVSNIKPLLTDLAKGINRAPAYLGVSVVDMTPAIAGRLNMSAQRGALVQGVTALGPAGRAGIRVNDVITAFDGKPVADAAGLVTLTRAHQPGDKAQVTYTRGSDSHTVTVSLIARPKA